MCLSYVFIVESVFISVLSSLTFFTDVHIEIFKDGKQLTLQQVEKQYLEWIFQMHSLYDEESDCGKDEPVIIINPSNKKQLGISSDGKV